MLRLYLFRIAVVQPSITLFMGIDKYESKSGTMNTYN
jgi:hypothetical protein